MKWLTFSNLWTTTTTTGDVSEKKSGKIPVKMSELPCYTILSLPTDLEAPNDQQLKSDLEKGDTKTKIAALKKVLHLILNGDKIPGILMTIIRFVLPSQVSLNFRFLCLNFCLFKVSIFDFQNILIFFRITW